VEKYVQTPCRTMTAPPSELKTSCIEFHACRYSQITHPCLTPPLGGIPSEFLDETCNSKTRWMGLLYGENCMILTWTVFDWSTRVTDRQTDGFAIAYSALSMLSRAKKRKQIPGCRNRTTNEFEKPDDKQSSLDDAIYTMFLFKQPIALELLQDSPLTKSIKYNNFVGVWCSFFMPNQQHHSTQGWKAACGKCVKSVIEGRWEDGTNGAGRCDLPTWRDVPCRRVQRNLNSNCRETKPGDREINVQCRRNCKPFLHDWLHEKHCLVSWSLLCILLDFAEYISFLLALGSCFQLIRITKLAAFLKFSFIE